MMPGDNIEPRPHIPFRRLDIERPRRRSSGRSTPPERDNRRHSSELGEALVLMRRDFEKSTDVKPPDFDPALIFKLRIEGTVDEENWRRSRLTLLNEDPDGIVVLFSNDQLAEFQRRIGEYGRELPENQKHPRYSWLAAITRDMYVWGREDRIGKKLKNIEINSNEEYMLDVELWHYGESNEIRQRMNELREFINRTNGEFLDYYIGSSLSIARIRISGEEIENLFNVDTVRVVDLPPEPDFTVGPLIQTRIDQFENPVQPPPNGSPGICVIDSGINSGHPILAPAIGYSQAVPVSLGDGLDEHGHGTMVSGIVLYGDVKECIENLNFEPKMYLFGARVTNAENRFDDEKLIVNQMREAIELFHQEYGCRIFNISLGDPELLFDGGQPSPWAQVLDTLARDLNIIIVVSAGNFPLLGKIGEDANGFMSSYPGYLLDDEFRIIEPATAANVITVGSLAHSETSHLMQRYPRDPAIRCLAGIDQPSPFTRHGPGVNGAIKPEVCEYGGNATWEGHSNRILDGDPGVSIISMHNRHLERLFRADVGTSLSAAKVSHVAGLILRDYAGISANLVRALIANSSQPPKDLDNLFDYDEQLRVCGYGIPDIDRALYSTDNRVTLYSEDMIPLNSLHLYEIPIPEELQQTTGRRRISISLSFDPPVRRTRKDYLGVKMSFKLFRGLTTERIVEWYAERNADTEIDKIPNRFECNMEPSHRRRENGTLQKAVFIASQNRSFLDYLGDTFHLLVRCVSGWAPIEEYPSQQYALVATIEHVQENINIYNLVQQRIRLRQRTRVRL
jgi:hypothetical protein